MGWCTAQWKMLLFFETTVKESCNFELAHLKKEKKKKKKEGKTFWLPADFLVLYR